MRRIASETDLKGFQERVCAAASALLAERGYDGFKMRELAARLGVSAMTTYRYFQSKNEIFSALRALAFNKLADHLEQLLDVPGTSLQRLVMCCRCYLDFARVEPARYRLMFDDSVPHASRSAELAVAQRRVLRALAEAALFASAGSMENGHQRAAQSLWAALHGLTALTLMRAVAEQELDALILDIARRFADGQNGTAELQAEGRASTAERQSGWSGRANGASLSGWGSVAAAE
jgi:AcrR family transcriptional regulator